jgi:hypothetical protein
VDTGDKRNIRRLRQIGVWMSDAGAVLLIFVIVAVALNAVQPRRKS